jgi:hypothetical protein
VEWSLRDLEGKIISENGLRLIKAFRVKMNEISKGEFKGNLIVYLMIFTGLKINQDLRGTRDYRHKPQ